MNHNLFAQLQSRTTDLSHVAIEKADGGDLTYHEVFALAGKMANHLRELGIKPGERIAVQAEKSPEALIFYLACVRAGAVYLPLNTAYTLNELEYFLTDSQPKLVVCSSERENELTPLARAINARLETLDQNGSGTLVTNSLAKSPEFATAVSASDELAAILYTSGTTGRSKGAMLTHANLVSNALTLISIWQYQPSDVLIHALPIYHTHGLFVATNVTLFANATMKLLAKFDSQDVLKLLKSATVLMGVPTFYTRLLEQPDLDHKACSTMRLFISGSAPLLSETHLEWQRRTGHAILERYGMTETNMIASNPYRGERLAGSVGFPLPHVSVRIADPESGRLLSVDEVGVIEVKGPNVFQGYWRTPEKTAQEFRADGFFITGDLGKFDSRGYLHILGRGKDLIITGGFNVYPKEVEAEIDALEGVLESAVIGLAHKDFGEAVTAVVVLKAHCSLNEKSILHALAPRLAKFKQPKRILFTTGLPRNSMGKVQKNLLRDEHRALYARQDLGFD